MKPDELDLLGDSPQKKNEPVGDFEAFWAEYPNKVAKAAALKAYNRSLKDVTHEHIMQGLERYKRTKEDWQKWAHASTWLNQGRYDDEPVQEPQAGEYEPYGQSYEQVIRRARAEGRLGINRPELAEQIFDDFVPNIEEHPVLQECVTPEARQRMIQIIRWRAHTQAQAIARTNGVGYSALSYGYTRWSDNPVRRMREDCAIARADGRIDIQIEQEAIDWCNGLVN